MYTTYEKCFDILFTGSSVGDAGRTIAVANPHQRLRHCRKGPFNNGSKAPSFISFQKLIKVIYFPADYLRIGIYHFNLADEIIVLRKKDIEIYHQYF